jgi:YHS domain-containing protein
MKTKAKKCPVCDWESKTGPKTVKVGGRNVVFCCDDCAEKVKANPAKYWEG